MTDHDYARFHQDRLNLVVHILMVPLFVGGTLGATWALASGEWLRAALLATLPGLSLAAQGWGHRREEVPTEPFAGPGDFVVRIATEQFYRFPAFVLSGGLDSAWRSGASRSRGSR